MDGYVAAGNSGRFGAVATGRCRAAGPGGTARRRRQKGAADAPPLKCCARYERVFCVIKNSLRSGDAGSFVKEGLVRL